MSSTRQYCRKYHRGVCTHPDAQAAAKVRAPTPPRAGTGLEAMLHNQARVRNVAILAHVDHGKTTVADRLLTKARALRDQAVATACSMDVGKMERDRGITIKATSTALCYEPEDLLVNLIDCPGERSRLPPPIPRPHSTG